MGIRGHLSRQSTAFLASALIVVASSCTPTPTPATPTKVGITTLITWCGGVMPPPGQPACTTSATSREVAITKKDATGIQVVTSTEGEATVTVDPGTYIVRAVDPEVYENCDEPMVTAVASQTTPITQTCTVYAP